MRLGGGGVVSALAASSLGRQHFLYLMLEPQGHGRFRPGAGTDALLRRLLDVCEAAAKRRGDRLADGAPYGGAEPLASARRPRTQRSRLGARAHGGCARAAPSWVLGDLALFGVGGWTLRPHSVRSIRYAFRRSEPFSEPDLVWDEPLRFHWEEIAEHPDRCGFRLVQGVYAAFGFYEDEIPENFDRETEVLRFPKE